MYVYIICYIYFYIQMYRAKMKMKIINTNKLVKQYLKVNLSVTNKTRQYV